MKTKGSCARQTTFHWVPVGEVNHSSNKKKKTIKGVSWLTKVGTFDNGPLTNRSNTPKAISVFMLLVGVGGHDDTTTEKIHTAPSVARPSRASSPNSGCM